MSEAERQVRAVYPMAVCVSRGRTKRDGSRADLVYEILRHPFPNDSDKRPVSTACLTIDAAWQNAARRLAKQPQPPQPNQRERTL